MRLSMVLLLAGCVLGFAGCQSTAKVVRSPWTAPEAPDIERLMDAYSREGMFNGIALVARNGEVIFEKGYGYANAEWEAPVDRHTKFRLASVTKQFTAMMILQLAEEGKLSLDDKISDHLKWYREDTGNRITIHHLLTHTSGIPNYSAFSGFFPGESRKTHDMQAFVKEFCSRDLESEPGERYSYCNSGYYILGAILEEIEGKPWEDVVKERITERGGMPDTGAYTHTQLMPRRAQGYWRDGEGVYQPIGYQDMTIWRAAGSMYSTANDMLRWDTVLRENVLLSPEWQEKMFSRQHGNYGYGVNVIDVENAQGETVRYMGHSGFYGGFNNYFAHFPETGEVVILLNNGGRTEINTIRDGVINILLGNPYSLPMKSFALHSVGDEPRLAISKISEHGVIGSDDATFRPVKGAAGTTIYSMNFLVHDGERVYYANTTGGDARIDSGDVTATETSLRNKGMKYSSTDWLTSDLDISVTGDEVPRLEVAWTFHNSSNASKPVRMMWFTDVDLTTAGSSSSEDRLAFVPKPNAAAEKMLLAVNHAEDGKLDSTTGLAFRVEGVPHHLFGVAGDAGASGYWRSSVPFESIGPRAAGYKIPEELRGKTQHDEDGDGVTDGPRDVGVSAEANLELPARGSQTVRFVVDFGVDVKL
jgi:CubicO group peptidase (beta-lactamase class C family)